MRYRVDRIIIRSENAAKPAAQTSAYMLSKISELDHVNSSFDFGCGKLRYRRAILKKTNILCLVDSEVQLSRTQMIEGKQTTIRAVANKSNNLSALNALEFRLDRAEFDRCFCINVLSVIPIPSVRQRVLNLIWSKLRVGGECLISVQYRNSDFSRMQKLENCTRWGDGFLMDSLRGHSFYGLIRPEKLAEMVSDSGLEVSDIDLNDGSVYLMAYKKHGC